MHFNFNLSNLNILKKQQIFAPVDGTILNIEEVNDVIFNQKFVGDGLAVKPSNGTILAPCNGTVECILIEKHALFISCDDKTKILVHLGIDTVELKGKGFHCAVTEKQKIKTGQLLSTINLDIIRTHNKDDTVIVVITKDSASASKIVFKNTGTCSAGKTVLFKYKN